MISGSSVYGQALLHFSEDFEPFFYFNMTPEFNDNYIPVSGANYNGVDANYQLPKPGFAPMGTYLGILQNDESGIKDSNGNLAKFERLLLWAEENLDPGWFVKYDNTTYRIIPSNDWKRQGGFTQYIIEKLIGSDGQGTVNSNLNDGSSQLL